MAVRAVFDGDSFWVVDDARKMASRTSFTTKPTQRVLEEFAEVFANRSTHAAGYWRASYNNIHPLLLMKELED